MTSSCPSNSEQGEQCKVLCGAFVWKEEVRRIHLHLRPLGTGRPKNPGSLYGASLHALITCASASICFYLHQCALRVLHDPAAAINMPRPLFTQHRSRTLLLLMQNQSEGCTAQSVQHLAEQRRHGIPQEGTALDRVQRFSGKLPPCMSLRALSEPCSCSHIAFSRCRSNKKRAVQQESECQSQAPQSCLS